MNEPRRTAVTHAPNGTPLFGVVGWKNSGKTTLTVALVSEFSRRGLKIATVKHAHHSFQIDDAETDSARHRRAGAGQVAIVSGSRWAMVTELRGASEPDFIDVVGRLAPCDLILVEGYKSAAIPKIEARRRNAATRDPLAASDPMVLAIASDQPLLETETRPVFDLNDVGKIADFILDRIGRTEAVGAR